MNNVDKQYLDLLQDILENGTYKNTRAGWVKSVFGRTMRFNLKEGLPLLTTKKVFYKGIIHELLWFLSGDTNIKYLVDNNVHIWDDDAYRWYLELSKGCKKQLTKEEFLEYVKNPTSFALPTDKDGILKHYKPGDLGPVYGHQWRKQGKKQIDQIQNIIKMLKTNPDDRRMICMAWNTNDFDDMALPPCHYGFQVYTRVLSNFERLEWLWEHSDGEYDEWKTASEEKLDELNVPKRELSLMFNMRSNDFCCGNPYNISQYSMLAYMFCEVCNMVPGELIYVGGDVHVYENHFEPAKEQLQRKGSEKLPILRFTRRVDNIDDFKYEDFIIENYNPDPSIKYPLNVGL
jgi:thymidylate synthase